MYKVALRIQARAIRRCGELLKEVQAKQGARTDLVTATTRSSAATDAGLSERQRNQALRSACLHLSRPGSHEPRFRLDDGVGDLHSEVVAIVWRKHQVCVRWIPEFRRSTHRNAGGDA